MPSSAQRRAQSETARASRSPENARERLVVRLIWTVATLVTVAWAVFLVLVLRWLV